jgi:hypothetical protein
LADLPRDEAHRADWIITTDDNTTAIARDPETLTWLMNH